MPVEKPKLRHHDTKKHAEIIARSVHDAIDIIATMNIVIGNGVVASVNGMDGPDVVIDADDIAEGLNRRWYPTADAIKMGTIETGATADQTGLEIIALINALGDLNFLSDMQLNNLNTLSDGSNADALHSHAGIGGSSNLDGGYSDANYGGIPAVDGGASI